MSTAARVASFAVGLAVVFGLALGVGDLFGPDTAPAGAAHDASGDDASGTARSPSADPANVPGGLMVSQEGYTLSLPGSTAAAGDAVPVQLTITGPDGQPVTAYDVVHEKRLHLIAVRRDLAGFQHVHPELAPDGTWSTALDLTPGPWRLFADFAATGADPLTLGADLAVPGRYRPETHSGEMRTATVDGYTVSLDGHVTPGTESRLTLSVERDGEPVTDLEPYLGAYGHLVALRFGDLAYLHVHPVGAPERGTTRGGPDVVFDAAVPSAGRYQLYLDFKHQGVVRTAAFTVGTSGSVPAPSSDDGNHGHDH